MHDTLARIYFQHEHTIVVTIKKQENQEKSSKEYSQNRHIYIIDTLWLMFVSMEEYKISSIYEYIVLI